MTQFSKISKVIGFAPRVVEYPTLTEAIQLRHASEDGNRYAFAKVMKYYRFLSSPADQYQKQVMQELTAAYCKSRLLFASE